MKNILIILFVIFVFLFDCNSQIINNKEKVFKTDQKFILGYSKQFQSLTFGISFQKNINLNDTTYYIEFLLTTSNSDDQQFIYLDKNNTLTFTSKTGKSIILLIDEKIKFEENNVHQNEQTPISPSYYYSAKFYLKITKEQLLQIGSEPFYQLMLTYNDAQAKTMKIAKFYSPKFYIRRSFTQRDIKDLLDK